MHKIKNVLLSVLLLSVLLLAFIISLVSANSTISDDNITNKEIKVPDELKEILKTIFNFEKQEDLSLTSTITLIILTLFFILTFKSILEIWPSIDKVTGWIGTIGITFIFAVSGLIKGILESLIFLTHKLDFLIKYEQVRIAIIILIIGVIYYIINLIVNSTKKRLALKKAKEEGEKAGKQIAKLKAMEEISS